MKIERVEVRQLALPMVDLLPAAHGVIDTRPIVVVAVTSEGVTGWGECVALAEPNYVPEWSDGEYEALQTRMAPLLLGDDVSFATVQTQLSGVAGHRTAKSAVEMAVHDWELRSTGVSFATHLGATATEIACCMVEGLKPIDDLLASVAAARSVGYQTFKLKITPGDEIERVAAVREAFPDVELRADANGSFDWANSEHRKALTGLDEFGLSHLEQPLAPSSIGDMTALRQALDTPVTLDESVTSYESAKHCLENDYVDVMTVKPGPLGGISVALAVHEVCREAGVPLSLGGMIDGGLSRAANLALAALPGFQGRAAEVSPDGRWFSESYLSEEVVAQRGRLPVPTDPGIADVSLAVVDRLTLRTSVATRNS